MNKTIALAGLLTLLCQNALADNPLLGKWKYVKALCASGTQYTSPVGDDAMKNSSIVFTATEGFFQTDFHLVVTSPNFPGGKIDCVQKEKVPYTLDGKTVHSQTAVEHSSTCPGDSSPDKGNDSTFEIVANQLSVSTTTDPGDPQCPANDKVVTVFTRMN